MIASAGIIGFIKTGLAFHSTVSRKPYPHLPNSAITAAFIDNSAGDQFLRATFATVRMAVIVICCCVITYKPIIARLHFFHRLVSSIAFCTRRIRLTKKCSTEDSDQTSRGWIHLNANGNGEDLRNKK